MQRKLSNFNIGKLGITDNFIDSLKVYFKKNKNLKIRVLKSARGQEKNSKILIDKYCKMILDKLGKNYSIRKVGFTICIKKLRKGKD